MNPPFLVIQLPFNTLRSPLVRRSVISLDRQVRPPMSEIFNINCGILGHVDSGKTSLVKALSTMLSTASLDKNPQSQARGITLDLGFSSFILPLPDRLCRQQHSSQKTYKEIQFTLV